MLGVLFHVSDEINLVLKNILDSAESVKNDAGKSNDIKSGFAPIELLPNDRSTYFRYEGSLTTPSCDEAVIWTVLDKSIPFSITQIERFKQVKDATGELLTHNYRQLQRLNSRPLVYVRTVRDIDNFINATPSLTVCSGLTIMVAIATISRQFW